MSLYLPINMAMCELEESPARLGGFYKPKCSPTVDTTN